MWSEPEIESILRAMRAGASVSSGGSRSHVTYLWTQADEWVCEQFDEGHVATHPCSEAFIRGLIEREPELFRGLLHQGPWSRFVAAFVAGDRPAAREALAAAAHYMDPEGRRAQWEAWLDWPERAPSVEVVERLRAKLEGVTAWHMFMDASGWERSEANAARGLAFAERLAAMLGERLGATIGLHWLRASFHELAGDREAARREVELELASLPASHWLRAHAQTKLDQLRASP